MQRQTTDGSLVTGPIRDPGFSWAPAIRVMLTWRRPSHVQRQLIPGAGECRPPTPVRVRLSRLIQVSSGGVCASRPCATVQVSVFGSPKNAGLSPPPPPPTLFPLPPLPLPLPGGTGLFGPAQGGLEQSPPGRALSRALSSTAHHFPTRHHQGVRLREHRYAARPAR